MLPRGLLIFAAVGLCPLAVRIRVSQIKENSSIEDVPRGMRVADIAMAESADANQTINFADEEQSWPNSLEPLTEYMRSGSDPHRENLVDALATPVLNNDDQVAGRTAGFFTPLSELARSGNDAQKDDEVDALWNFTPNAANQVGSSVVPPNQSSLAHVSTKRSRLFAGIESMGYHVHYYDIGLGVFFGWLSCCCLMQWLYWLYRQQEQSGVVRLPNIRCVPGRDPPGNESQSFDLLSTLSFRAFKKKANKKLFFKETKETGKLSQREAPDGVSPRGTDGSSSSRAASSRRTRG